MNAAKAVVRLTGLCLWVTFIFAVWSRAAADDGPDTGDSFRIATFNTHLLSPIFNKQLFDSDHADSDAHMVADAVAADTNGPRSFDAIVLNEVWDEDAKDILAKTLSPIFPYYVKKLDAGLNTFGETEVGQIFGQSIKVKVPKLEDSGLMLFSKLPFESFTIGNPPRKVNLAFRCFADCSGFDAGASKGVGLVVLRNPSTARRYVVAFSHTQDGSATIRAKQMNDIAKLVAHVRKSNPELTRGEAFVLGDLNIDGCNLPEKDLASWTPLPEWAQHFWNKQSYFTNPLYDPWALTTSPLDLGMTSPGGGSRLDYIIHEAEKGHEPYFVQHIHHVLVGKTNSDHTAVAADLNRPSPHCMPRLARRPETEPLFANDAWDWFPIAGKLKYSGSMQWYRFDKKGTYSIGVPTELFNQGLRVSVYAKDDLSTPINVYNKETSTKSVITKLPDQNPVVKEFSVGKYHIPEPPFYVCVHNPVDRRWRGNYFILFHRNRGATKDDAITLAPGEELLDPSMPTDKPLNPADAVWFELVTDKAHSGKPQRMEIVTDNKSGQPLKLDLLNDSGALTLASTGWSDQPLMKRDEVGGKKFYLTLARKAFTQKGFSIGWQTNLTWLVGVGPPGAWPFKLVCDDETGADYLGSDEIDMYVKVDGELCPNPAMHFGDVDSDDHYTLEGMMQPIAFLESVTVQLSENDDDGKSWSSIPVISPLTGNQTKALGLEVGLDPDDGWYLFRYNLTHSLNK